ncbi:MAG: hypothetical protein J2P40_16595 [Candidatus Dormibacteraeota bacterium]|nr:hypothetical protein [Candidatus Dormibacteraeota bacterium]MBO0762894.1 hypothetical protein [Candidatus Dormibacteraeota bacterium]
MTIEEARELWSRAVGAVRTGRLRPDAYRTIRERLVVIRDGFGEPERARLELYLDLLAEEWADATAATPSTEATERLRQAQDVLADGMREDGDRRARMLRARVALRALGDLAEEADEPTERMAIGRMCEPLTLLLGKLEHERPAGAAR